MAFYLEKRKTVSTPYVLIDEEKGYMKLEGRSYSEDIVDFFGEIAEWLETYLKTDFKKFIFDCQMDYFNSSTVKILLNMIEKMDRYSAEENKVIINWITTYDNEIIIECGEDLKEDIENLEFNFKIV